MFVTFQMDLINHLEVKLGKDKKVSDILRTFFFLLSGFICVTCQINAFILGNRLEERQRNRERK